MRLRGIGNLFLRRRQGDADRGSLTAPAAKRNRTAVLVNDFLSVRHTEAESLRLRCIERLEDLFRLFLLDSRTGISDLESQRLTGFVNDNTQRAAFRHGFDS